LVRLFATTLRGEHGSDADVEISAVAVPQGKPPCMGFTIRNVGRRLHADTTFAVCYADLDHFKEYNDRYSYYEGDRVIRILARILHDVVKGLCGEVGFVGHIGGDDFIFIVPTTTMAETCGEIVGIFDTLVPYQYSEHDRRSGYFFGKDRRGQLYRVPLMTVSIGVVTNERRQFTHAAQMAELATEMKSYAKTLEGSVYAIDRRQDAVGEPTILVSDGRGYPEVRIPNASLMRTKGEPENGGDSES
jgi:GGDEF domain-containing protein